MKLLNPLEKLLYAEQSVANTALSSINHKLERGVFLSINNYKQGSDTLYQSLRKQYGSLVYAMTGKNIPADCIKSISGSVPSHQKIMDAVVAKKLIMVAAMHHYDYYKTKSGRGSISNVDYQHLHLYVYGIHHYIGKDDASIDDALDYIPRVLFRHNRFCNKSMSPRIDIKPVGVGKYLFSDVVTPNTLYNYLELPKAEPSKKCIINYLADTSAYDGNNYQLTYIYQEA